MSKLSKFQTLRWAGFLFLILSGIWPAVFDHSPAFAADAYMAELSQLGLAPATESERAVMGRPFDALVVDAVQLAEAGLGGLRNGDVVQATRVGPGWWRLRWSGASIWTSVEEADVQTKEPVQVGKRGRATDSARARTQSLARATRPTPEPHSPPLVVASGKTKPGKSTPTASPRTSIPKPTVSTTTNTTTTSTTTTTTTPTQHPTRRSGPPTTVGKIVVSSAAIVRPTDQEKAGFKEEDLMSGEVRGRVSRINPDDQATDADAAKTPVIRDKGKRKIITLIEQPEDDKTPVQAESRSSAAKQDRTASAAPTPSEPGPVVETVVASAPEPITRPSDDRPVPDERKESPAEREPSPEKQPTPPPTQPDRRSVKNAIQPVDPFSERAEDDFPTDRAYTQSDQAAATTSLPDPAPVTTTLPPAPPVTTTTTAAHPPTPSDEQRAAKKPVPPFPTPDIPAATEPVTEPAVDRATTEPTADKIGDKIRPDQAQQPSQPPSDYKSAAKIKSSAKDEVASAESSVRSGNERPASKTYWINRIRAFKRSGSLFIQVRVSHRAKAVFYRFKAKDGDTWLVVDFPNTQRRLHIKGLVKVRSSVIRRIRSADHENSVRLSAAVRTGVKFRASARWRGSTFELRITPRK